jgi:mono/diheme cytochrome c family protein
MPHFDLHLHLYFHFPKLARVGLSVSATQASQSQELAMLRGILLSFATVAASLAVVALVVTAPKSVTAADLPPHTPDVTNGQTMFQAGGCAACHASPGQQDTTRLGGGVVLKTAYGTFVTPNISPDEKDGIGGWSEANFVSAMHEGTSPVGANLFPAFPYPSYARMHIADVRDLFAYIKTLPPVVGQWTRGHNLRFPFAIRPLIGIWKYLYFDDTVLAPEPNKSVEWNRGAYLVSGPGHCAECHSPRNALGAVIDDRRFSGGPNPAGEGTVPSITQAHLDIWSVEDIETLLASGKMPDGDTVSGVMARVVKNTSALSPEDRRAMAVYVKSLPPAPGEKKAD